MFRNDVIVGCYCAALTGRASPELWLIFAYEYFTFDTRRESQIILFKNTDFQQQMQNIPVHLL